MTEPITRETVAEVLKRAGFSERVTGTQGRQERRAPTDGFQLFDHDAGGILACWIPVTGQDPQDLDAFARSYDMARAYAVAARNAGWGAKRWGVIWHYALIAANLPDWAAKIGPRAAF